MQFLEPPTKSRLTFSVFDLKLANQKKPQKMEINQIYTLSNYDNSYCVIGHYPDPKSPGIIIGSRNQDYRKLNQPYGLNCTINSNKK